MDHEGQRDSRKRWTAKDRETAGRDGPRRTEREQEEMDHEGQRQQEELDREGHEGKASVSTEQLLCMLLINPIPARGWATISKTERTLGTEKTIKDKMFPAGTVQATSVAMAATMRFKLQRVLVCMYVYIRNKGRYSSVQFKMISMCSGRPVCAPPRLSGVSPMLSLKQFQCWSD